MMPHISKRGVMLLPAMMLVFVAVMTGLQADAEARAIIPDDLTMQSTYRHGIGQSVGTVKMARGKAFIMHSDRRYGYAAKTGLPLYNRDTLFTREGGRMVVELNDGSQMTLAPQSSLLMNKSVYDPKGQNRLSFMEMLAGKARFVVKKLAEYKYSRFNVKTHSSVVGVRGSDFIVERMTDSSRVTALEDTTLEVSSLDFPDAPPVIVRDFQQLGLRPGERPGQPRNVPRDQIQNLMQGVDGGDDTGDGDDDGDGDPSGDEGDDTADDDTGDDTDDTGDDTGDSGDTGDTDAPGNTQPLGYVPEDGPPPEEPDFGPGFDETPPPPEPPLQPPVPDPEPPEADIPEPEEIIQEITDLPDLPGHP